MITSEYNKSECCARKESALQIAIAKFLLTPIISC